MQAPEYGIQKRAWKTSLDVGVVAACIKKAAYIKNKIKQVQHERQNV